MLQSERVDGRLTWLKSLREELVAERKISSRHPESLPILESGGETGLTLTMDDIDRVLISRLEMDPAAMSLSARSRLLRSDSFVITPFRDDQETLKTLASIPAEETVLTFLTGCWKRLYTAQSLFAKTVRRLFIHYASHT
jgi:ubiquitin conjugation factor E4 B